MVNRARSWEVFRIRGVGVRIHFSLFILLLYVLIVTNAAFPVVARSVGIDPWLIQGGSLLWAAIFSVSLVLSILVHEFGHVFVAQAKGAKPSSVTLLMLGGVTEMKGHSSEPRDEWKIAVIGPVVSLAIGGALLWLRRQNVSLETKFFCEWIGQLNIVLGVFNLIPAFPTDGGRILRSVLAQRNGRERGTRQAVAVSRVFAWIFGIVGLFQLNFILILIAFFLYLAAQSELLVVTGESVLKGLAVRHAMTVVPSVRAEASLASAARTMLESGSPVLPVEESENAFGVISIDAMRRIPREQWDQVPVRSVETISEPVEGSTPLESVVTKGLTSDSVPVIEEGRIAGLLRAQQLAEMIRLRTAFRT